MDKEFLLCIWVSLTNFQDAKIKLNACLHYGSEWLHLQQITEKVKPLSKLKKHNKIPNVTDISPASSNWYQGSALSLSLSLTHTCTH